MAPLPPLAAQANPPSHTPDPPAGARPRRTGSGPRVWERESGISASPLGLFAAIAAAALTIAADPQTPSTTFSPKYAVMLLIAGVGIVPLIQLCRSGPAKWPARFIAAFVVVGLISAATSAVPMEGFFGAYLWGTGVFFWLACAGGFAITARLDSRDRRLVAGGILVGVLANALLGIAQVYGTRYAGGVFTAGLLQTYNGQADGFLGNPVHFEALLCGGAALLVGRAASRPWPWLVPAGIVSFALALSAERLAPFLLFALCVYALFRHHWKGLLYSAVTGGTYLAGILSGTTSTVVSRVASSSNTTYGARFGIWKLALKAFAARPWLGYGPGEFMHATSPLMTQSFSGTLGPDRYFTDAHNIVIEVLVTTGVLGLVCLASFMLSAAKSAQRCALLGFAVFTLVIRLVEPLNIGTEPVVFMAIGAAVAAGLGVEDRVAMVSWQRIALSVLALAGLLGGISVVAGDSALYQAEQHFSLSQANRASNLLPEWPDSASEVATVDEYLAAVHPGKGYLARARAAIGTAIARQSTDMALWADAGTLDMKLNRLHKASEELHRALALAPYEYQALFQLTELSIDEHDRRAAEHYRHLLISTYPSAVHPGQISSLSG